MLVGVMRKMAEPIKIKLLQNKITIDIWGYMAYNPRLKARKYESRKKRLGSDIKLYDKT